uniref:Uncharacterized protein n=1 Tax=Amphimedon queenslandica TaxID=400682 RepID=A0A1X7UG20_AMPQE
MVKSLPSDPDFLLNLLDDLPSDGSNNNFDGYVTDFDDQDDQQVQDVFTGTDAFTDVFPTSFENDELANLSIITG